MEWPRVQGEGEWTRRVDKRSFGRAKALTAFSELADAMMLCWFRSAVEVDLLLMSVSFLGRFWVLCFECDSCIVRDSLSQQY